MGKEELVSTDFARVLFALKENIMKSVNVADVARVMSVSGSNYFCESIADGSVVNAIKLDNINIDVGDFVVIVFCNRDFRANLKMANYMTKFKETNNNQQHSSAFGVIIGKLFIGDEDDA